MKKKLLIGMLSLCAFASSSSSMAKNVYTEGAIGIVALPISVPAAVIGSTGLAVWDFTSVVAYGFYMGGGFLVDAVKKEFPSEEKRAEKACYRQMNGFEGWWIEKYEKEHDISKLEVLHNKYKDSLWTPEESERIKKELSDYKKYVNDTFSNEIAMASKFTDISSKYFFKGKLDFNVFFRIGMNNSNPEKINSEENINLKYLVASQIRKLNKDNPEDQKLMIDLSALAMLNTDFSVYGPQDVCVANGPGVSVLSLPHQTDVLIALLKSKMK